MPGRAVARTGLRMMPTFPPLSLKFRKAGFPRYGFKAGLSGGAFPSTASSSRRAVCLHPSCTSLPVASYLVLSRGTRCAGAPPCKRHYAALPQGHSLRSKLCCLGPSLLIRPHPPHSWAHLDFTDSAYTKCPRCASETATPRRPASGSELSLVFLIGMPSSETPGSSSAACHPVAPPWTLAFDPSGGSRHFRYPHPPILVGEPISGLHYRSLS